MKSFELQAGMLGIGLELAVRSAGPLLNVARKLRKVATERFVKP
jgi:hypothetical protein